jgi:hypothetical protein
MRVLSGFSDCPIEVLDVPDCVEVIHGFASGDSGRKIVLRFGQNSKLNTRTLFGTRATFAPAWERPTEFGLAKVFALFSEASLKSFRSELEAEPRSNRKGRSKS